MALERTGGLSGASGKDRTNEPTAGQKLSPQQAAAGKAGKVAQSAIKALNRIPIPETHRELKAILHPTNYRDSVLGQQFKRSIMSPEQRQASDLARLHAFKKLNTKK